MLPELNPMVAVHMPDKAEMECEYIERLSGVSGINASAVGPGLDSDFGASAGMVHTDQLAGVPNMDIDLFLFFQVFPCGSSQQTATLCPTVQCPRPWSGITTTHATSSRTMYPNTKTTDLQCTLNNTGYSFINHSKVLKHVYFVFILFIFFMYFVFI